MLRHPFYESQDFFLNGLLGRFHTIFAWALGEIPHHLCMGSWCQVAFGSPGQADGEEKTKCLLGVGHWAEDLA